MHYVYAQNIDTVQHNINVHLYTLQLFMHVIMHALRFI